MSQRVDTKAIRERYSQVLNTSAETRARSTVVALCDRVDELEAALRYLRTAVPDDARGTLAYVDAVLEGRER